MEAPELPSELEEEAPEHEAAEPAVEDPTPAKRHRGAIPKARQLSRRRVGEGMPRSQLTIREKRQVVLHKIDNPNMSLDELASWVAKRFDVKVHLSSICKWLKKKDQLLAARDQEACRERPS
jgi:transposase